MIVWRYCGDVLIDLLVRPRLSDAKTLEFDDNHFEWAFLFRQPRKMRFLVTLICNMDTGKPRWSLKESTFNPKEWPAEKCVWTEYIGKVMHARRNLESVLDYVEWPWEIDNYDCGWISSEWAKGRLQFLKRKDMERDDAKKVCYIWIADYEIEEHCERMERDLQRKLEWMSASNAWMQAIEIGKLLDDAIRGNEDDENEEGIISDYDDTGRDSPLRTI